MPTIPLSAAFAGQCLLIAAAFTAVILVLTERQRTEFESAIEDKIYLQQQNANSSVLLPFLTREEPFRQMVYKMIKKPSLQVNDNSTLTSMMPFFEICFMLVKGDPLVTNVGQIALSETFTHANGDPYWHMSGTSEDLWTMVVKNGVGYVAVQNDYPLSLAATIPPVAYDISYDPMINHTAANVTRWMRPRAFMNVFTNTVSFSITMASPLARNPITGKVIGTALMTVDLSGIKDIIASQLVSTTTHALLISVDRHDVWVSTDASVPQYSPAGTSWTTDNYPIRKQIDQYYEAAAECPSPFCSFKILEIGDAIVSLINIRTVTELNLHLMQSTPRSYFYAASEKSRTIGIVVGVFAAVAVVALSVWVSAAIHRPLSRLQVAMSLAALMKNEEAEASSGTLSMLSEVWQIQNSFLSMNKRLLLARPFLPQSLLLVDDSSGQDDEEDDIVSPADGRREQPSDQCPSNCESPAENGIQPNKSPSSSCTSYSQSHTTDHTRKRGRLKSIIVGHAASLHAIPMSRHQSLGTRRVGVLMINLRGFHALTCGNNIDTLGVCVRSLCAMVESVVQADKGIVDAFHGDHFTVTYNVARTIGNPGQAGAMSAIRLRTELRNIPEFHRQSLSMGLAVGKAAVGNLGSDTIKKLCVVGPVFSEGVALERMAKAIHQDCLVMERALDGMESVAYTLVVGMLSCAGGSIAKFDQVRAIMDPVDVCPNDEWMYEVSTRRDIDPYAMLNDSMKAYLAGDLEMARLGLARATGAAANASFSLSMSTGPQLIGLSASTVMGSPKGEAAFGSESSNIREFMELSNIVSTGSPTLQSLSNNVAEGTEDMVIKAQIESPTRTKRLLWAAERVTRLVNSGVGNGYYDAYKMACAAPATLKL